MRSLKLIGLLSATVLGTALLASGARAQSVTADGRTNYDAAYFAAYSPSNALDIVQRIPGFALQSGDQNVRGFGQAAGNLVINGERPSSKSDNLETILSRIPASRVLRVEVGGGDLYGSEYSGRAQVVNLVLTDAGGLSATIDATIRRIYTGRTAPQGTVSLLWRTGQSTFNGSIGYESFIQTEEGFDRIIALPSRAEIEFRRKVNRIAFRSPNVSGSWNHAGGDNRAANLNFRVADGRFALTQTNDVYPASGPVRDDRLSQIENEREYEVGGDVTRPLFGGGIKLIGLATRNSERNAELVFNRIRSSVIGGFEQNQRSQNDERVVRAVWSHSNIAGWSVETGAEGAFNRLKSRVDLFSIGSNAVRTRIDLPVDDAIVSEYRGEAFINAGRRLSPTLRMDMGLTYEASRLTVSGDATAERSLRFWKPRASLDWNPGGGWRLQLSAARTVAQLDFDDFISLAELTNDRVNGGNPQLLPQRAWEVLGTVERPLWGDGRVKVELGYHQISLLQDRVPTPEGFDAPGNLGDGQRRFVRGTIDAPLARFGIIGGRLTMRGTLQDTSVRDPYTGLNRNFSGEQSWEFQTSFRQDMGQFAWGLSYFGSPAGRVYRRNEEDSFNGQEPFMQAFAEYRPNRRTTMTLTADNLADVAATRTRLFFAPDRSNTTPSRFEERARFAHTTLIFNIKYSLN